MVPIKDCDIEISGPEGPLQGRLLLPPHWGHDVVLMIPGSGPTNRDGNSPSRINASTLRLIADGLSDLGIGSLRIDKRGLFGSAQAVSNPDDVTLQDSASDVSSWVQELARDFAGARIWILGHSEGGLVALSTEPTNPLVKGLILLATPGRPLGAILREQLAHNPANDFLLNQAFAAIASLEAGQCVSENGMHPALASLLRPSVQGFLINALAMSPSARAAQFQKPVLVLQSGADLQVSGADAEALAKAAPQSTLRYFPSLNHVFKKVRGDDTANISSYANADLPLGFGIVQAISAFIHAKDV